MQKISLIVKKRLGNDITRLPVPFYILYNIRKRYKKVAHVAGLYLKDKCIQAIKNYKND